MQSSLSLILSSATVESVLMALVFAFAFIGFYLLLSSSESLSAEAMGARFPHAEKQRDRSALELMEEESRYVSMYLSADRVTCGTITASRIASVNASSVAWPHSGRPWIVRKARAVRHAVRIMNGTLSSVIGLIRRA